MRKLSLIGIIIFGSVLGWSADYLTDGPDIGRTGWVRDEKIFNTANVKNMKLLWKIKLESAPRQMHNFFAPLVVEKVAVSGGTKEIAVVSGISDDLFGIDVASGKQIWHKHFDSTFTPPDGRGGGTLCPGGQLATPVIGPGSQAGRYTIYALSWDGRLRQVNVADGEDRAAPEKFMPPNGKPWSLNLYDGTIYTAVSQSCGGIPNSFFSFNLATRKSSAFLPRGGGMWGRRGVAIGTDGTVYIGTGDGVYIPETKNLGSSIVAVKLDENKELQPGSPLRT
jgi:outer membrane protein assembly factor BamB